MVLQNKHKPYRIIVFSQLVLYKIYTIHLNDDSKSDFEVDDIVAAFDVPVSKNLVVSALDLLRAGDYENAAPVTRKLHKESGSYTFRITRTGLEKIERDLRLKSSAIWYFHTSGDETLDEVAGIEGRFGTIEEALDNDPWSPLDIDRSDPIYAEAVAELDTALHIIEGDNGFAATYPNERDGILSSLKLGIEWLKNNSPSRAQIFSLVITPLEWISGNFSKAIIGEAAKKAAEAVIKLLHSYFG